MTNTDWLDPIVLDAVWTRLLFLDFVWHRWSTMDPLKIRKRNDIYPLTVAFAVPLVCRTMRSLTLRKSRSLPVGLFLMLQLRRRWWHGLWPARNQWLIACELATRHFAAELQRIEAQTGCPLVIAGDFAAWQCVHEQALLHGGKWPERTWVPDNIEVFTPQSRFTKQVRCLVRAAYARFFRILHVMCAADMHPISIKSTQQGASDHVFVTRLSDCVERTVGEPGLRKLLYGIISEAPDRVVGQDRVVETIRLSGVLPSHCQRFPSTYGRIAHKVNIVVTREQYQPAKSVQCNRLPYVQWLLDGFDLVHCAVALRIDCETGIWRFFHSQTTRSCIHSMTLRFQAKTSRDALSTLSRACQSILHGFQIKPCHSGIVATRLSRAWCTDAQLRLCMDEANIL